MSQTRDALEAAQRALAVLEANAVPAAELQVVADQLAREIETWETMLDRGEKRVLATERVSLSGSVLSFGFAVVFVGPVVAIVGTALSRMMRHETELNVVTLISGIILISLALWPRARRAIAHRVSPEWRMLRLARRHLHALGERAGREA